VRRRMSRIRRDLYRGRLTKLLEMADDEAFFVMVWATLAIQSERQENARRYLVFPQEAVTSDMSSRYAVHPWKLETMLNEVLTTPKLKLVPNRPIRRLDCRQFGAVARVHNVLRDLENAEDSLTLNRIEVLREIPRLAQRQFEWQRGILRFQQLFRAGFIYGGPLTRTFFSTVNGFSIDDFALGCFALRAMFIDRPAMRRGGGMDTLGISEKTLDAIVQLISIPHLKARQTASTIRSGGGHTAYKRSLFREYPCVAFGDTGDRIHAPLPDLVTLRASSGLFYDLIKGSDEVRNEISGRFESYCRDFLQSMLPSYVVSGSYEYNLGKNQIAGPDVLVKNGEEIALIVECKATRMSYEARFSEDPISDARRGYDEIAKGVFQIWRFVSHHRRGLVGGTLLRDDARGIVLTLDTWLSMAKHMQSDVLNLAKSMAAARDPEIIEADQIPVIFCPVDDLELTLCTATEVSFFRSVKAATEDRFHGWQLADVHRQIAPELKRVKEYPFKERVADVLPWWSLLSDTVEEQPTASGDPAPSGD
jgi:hypothetical protein